jgi:hypothetical protein
VHEAEGWLGTSSGLLGRARHLGPHPFVTLSLQGMVPGLPVVRTPFQVFWLTSGHVQLLCCI